MTERVLLTGAGGFAGAHILRHLLAHTSWHVTATDSFRHKGKTDRVTATLEHGEAGWRERVDVITHDLAVPVSYQMTGRIGRVDYLIALASGSHVDRSIADPAGFARNNVEIALTTLEYARVARPRHVIWVSTDEVYGPAGPGSAGHPEWAPAIPSNPYSASKAAQEALAVAWWRTYGVPVTIVNSMNLIGEMQDPEKYLPRLIGLLSRRQPVVVHGAAGDIGSRHYLHARNLADALVFILAELPPPMFPAAGRPARWNIAGQERISNLELAQQVAGLLGVPLTWRLEDFHATRPGHDPHYALDGSALAAAGWKPPVAFPAALARVVEWTLAHPEWLA